MAKKLNLRNPNKASNIAVIGLGRFGTSLALELVKSGCEVLGIDSDDRLVQASAAGLTHVVKADSTNEETLRELGIDEFDAAVVAIGSDLEASILTASLLLQLGVKQVWVKATSSAHGRILEQLGVHHVVFPEADMGRRVAHMVAGESLDYIEIAPEFVMVKISAPTSFDGQTLAKLELRKRYGVTVVATGYGDQDFKNATPETIIHKGDHLLLAGPTDMIRAFGQLS